MSDSPETHYATTEVGVSIAYQTVGDGPIDLVLELENFGNVEIMWELDVLADLFGRLSAFSRVTIGSRVAALASPSVVLVSRTVKDLTAESGFSFDDMGEHELKGVPDRWQVYRALA